MSDLGRARPRRAEARPRRAEARPRRAEARPRRAEVHPPRAEPRPRKAEVHPRRAEPRPRRAEVHPRRAEPRPRRAEARPRTTEARPLPRVGRDRPTDGAIHEVWEPELDEILNRGLPAPGANEASGLAGESGIGSWASSPEESGDGASGLRTRKSLSLRAFDRTVRRVRKRRGSVRIGGSAGHELELASVRALPENLARPRGVVRNSPLYGREGRLPHPSRGPPGRPEV